MRPFDGRRVLLVVSGGIAAYKSVYLARRLVEAGATIDAVLTESAGRFVGEVTFEGVTGRPVHTDTWERPMAHLDLGREADLAIVAPASAETLARMAAGRADDLAAATLLAADCPVLIAPAMNTRMWKNPATVRNVAALVEAGYEVIGPDDGPLAERESGPGRMSEPEDIMTRAGRILQGTSELTDRRVIVTAGPTRAHIDPVRFIGNRSSGRMGYALAAAAWRRGGDVILITGPGTAARPRGPRTLEVETAREMLEALEEHMTPGGILLMAAAVSDFEVPDVAPSKIKKGEAGLDLHLAPGPDLLRETRARRESLGMFTLGFALETEEALEHGRAKLDAKGMQMIAINDATEPGAGFDVETNRVTLVDAEGHVEELPLMSKRDVADRLLDRVEGALR